MGGACFLKGPLNCRQRNYLPRGPRCAWIATVSRLSVSFLSLCGLFFITLFLFKGLYFKTRFLNLRLYTVFFFPSPKLMHIFKHTVTRLEALFAWICPYCTSVTFSDCMNNKKLLCILDPGMLAAGSSPSVPRESSLMVGVPLPPVLGIIFTHPTLGSFWVHAKTA